MAIPLFFEDTCKTGEEDFGQRIRDFTALMPVREPPTISGLPNFATIQHSKEKGLINFDFTIEDINRLLSFSPNGLRIIPSLTKKGELTVVITPYVDVSGRDIGDEVFEDNKLVAICCPQPPPPFNLVSKLYNELYLRNYPKQPPLL